MHRILAWLIIGATIVLGAYVYRARGGGLLIGLAPGDRFQTLENVTDKGTKIAASAFQGGQDWFKKVLPDGIQEFVADPGKAVEDRATELRRDFAEGVSEKTGEAISDALGVEPAPRPADSGELEICSSIPRGSSVNYTLRSPAPATATVDWGDGNEDKYEITSSANNVSASHRYDRPGTYKVVFRARESTTSRTVCVQP